MVVCICCSVFVYIVFFFVSLGVRLGQYFDLGTPGVYVDVCAVYGDGGVFVAEDYDYAVAGLAVCLVDDEHVCSVDIAVPKRRCSAPHGRVGTAYLHHLGCVLHQPALVVIEWFEMACGA